MVKQEYQGLLKYKLLIPAVYIISWISMFTGPLYYPILYQKIQIVVLLFFTIKSLSLCATMLYICFCSLQLIEKYQNNSNQINSQHQLVSPAQKIYHAFILPNYKEDLEVMSETLSVLAGHQRAKEQYLIFLAMEGHEPGSQDKAKQLLKRFQGQFLRIKFTKHQLRSGEIKAKSSNINWCAEKMEEFLNQFSIEADNVMLTIIDADSWTPQIYMHQVNRYLANNKNQKDCTLFSAPQIFTRNNMDVPVCTRAMDLIHMSGTIPNQLFSFSGLSYTISNYTLSYNLMKKVGYLDTCADAFLEDTHFPQKLYWKLQGQVKVVPIYVPFNQLNIQVGSGCWQQFKARFWQNQKHSEQLATLAYSLKQFFNQPFRLQSVGLIWGLLQANLVFPIVPWMLISLSFQFQFLYRIIDQPQQILGIREIGLLVNTMNASNIILYLLYEYFERVTNSRIYKKVNKSLWRILEVPLMFVVCVNCIQIPGFLISAFKVLKNDKQFTVSAKQVNKTDADEQTEALNK